MLFALEKAGNRATERRSVKTAACVGAICLLASLPLLIAIPLTLWGG